MPIGEPKPTMFTGMPTSEKEKNFSMEGLPSVEKNELNKNKEFYERVTENLKSIKSTGNLIEDFNAWLNCWEGKYDIKGITCIGDIIKTGDVKKLQQYVNYLDDEYETYFDLDGLHNALNDTFESDETKDRVIESIDFYNEYVGAIITSLTNLGKKE